MKKIVAFSSIILLLFACTNPYAEIENMSWLNGTWRSNVQGNDMVETWKRTNDSTWTGQSEFKKNGEILFSEEMTVSKRNKILRFTSSSDDQNEGKTVVFTAKEVEKNKVIFENLTHDFPQQIVYEKNHKDSMIAYISGNLNGKKERINFRMSKLK